MTDSDGRTWPILPAQLLVEDRYDTLSKAPRLLPTLLIHGTSDTVVPVDMGQRLAEKIPRVTVFLVPGADHNNVYDWGWPKFASAYRGFLRRRNPRKLHLPRDDQPLDPRQCIQGRARTPCRRT